MISFLIFILGIAVGAIAVWLFVYKGQSQQFNILENVGMSGKASFNKAQDKPGLLERQAREKAENKRSILGILETQSPLTNNHVEQLLGISDATATRYLDELEKEGHVRQVGRTGKHVYYEKAK